MNILDHINRDQTARRKEAGRKIDIAVDILFLYVLVAILFAMITSIYTFILIVLFAMLTKYVVRKKVLG